MKEIFSNKYLYIIPLLLFLTFRLPGLGGDISNSDAARWHRRSENFLTAIKTADFASTYQHYQPGVLLMWVNAFVKQAAFSYQNYFVENPKTLENADYYPFIHGISKATIVLILAAVFLFQIFAVKNLFSPLTAFFYGILVSLEPYLVGVDRWFHLTSLETYFLFASFLSLLLWYRGLEEDKYLYISADFFALSLLSKLTSIVLLPVILLVLVKKATHLRDPAFPFLYKPLHFFRPLFIYGVTTIAVIVILFPALWVNPQGVLLKMYTAITSAVSGDARGTQITGWMSSVYYFVILALKLSPITFVLSLCAIFNYKIYKENHLLGSIPLYLLLFLFSLSFSDKKIDRYVISFIPPLMLLVSVGVARFSKEVQKFVFMLVVLFSVWNFYLYYPIFSSYYSPIFGGTKRALDLNVYENSGEYFAQAASYLNKKGRDINTYVPNNVESFSYFYKGNLQGELNSQTNYVVGSLNIDRKKFNYPGCKKVEAAFGPVDKNVVYIFKCGSI